MEPIILASGSPRRQELLKQIGVPFEVVKSAAEELKKLPKGKDGPANLVIENAKRKAEDVIRRYPDRKILAADTIVYHEGKVYGKPKNEEDAREMLRELSGRTHHVLTGVVLLWDDETKPNVLQRIAGAEDTLVTFSRLSEQEIADYVATGEPMDKAGAYAIQGRAAAFIPQINGSFSNVVGLPLHDVVSMLKQAGAM